MHMGSDTSVIVPVISSYLCCQVETFNSLSPGLIRIHFWHYPMSSERVLLKLHLATHRASSGGPVSSAKTNWWIIGYSDVCVTGKGQGLIDSYKLRNRKVFTQKQILKQKISSGASQSSCSVFDYACRSLYNVIS